MMPKLKSKSVGLVASTIVFVLLLVILEFIGFTWENNVAKGNLGWTLVASRRLEFELQGSLEKPYYLLKANKSYQWEGIPVEIGSMGFRTNEFEENKPSDLNRILIVGDSIVFGWRIFQEEMYGVRLEELLNISESGDRYEVINAGVPTWNLESARNFILQEGMNYDPDLVILNITVVNDVYGAGAVISDGFNLFEWLRDNTYAWPLITIQTRMLLSRSSGPEAMPMLNPPLEPSYYFPLNRQDNQWDLVWKNITRINDAVVQNNSELVLIIFPSAFQLNELAHPSTPQEVLSERAIEEGIPFIDMLPIYREVCSAAEKGACDGYENLLFADVWMHPNNKGHELAAEALHQYIFDSIK